MSHSNTSNQDVVAQTSAPTMVERLQQLIQQGVAGQASFRVRLAGKCADANLVANCKIR